MILLPLLLPILFVVICADIFIIWPFLVTKTIFSNECHTQQRNLKIHKVCYKFQTTEVSCNYSALQWLTDYMSHIVCVTAKFTAQQPPMTTITLIQVMLLQLIFFTFIVSSVCYCFVCCYSIVSYWDGAGNTVEENSSVFSLIRMRQLSSVLWHCWLGGRKGIRPVKNGGMMEVGTD